MTGGNKGIGFAVVKEMCKKFDGIVYLTARDEGRGQAAVEELKKVWFILVLRKYVHVMKIISMQI